MYKCNCGCSVFIEHRTFQYDDRDFRLYAVKSNLEHTANIVISQCIKCSRLHIPATSFNGRNALDPEFKVYSEVVDAVESWNNLIDISDNNLKIIQNEISSRINLEEKVKEILSLQSIPDPPSAPQPRTVEENIITKVVDPNVKATGRSRKKS